MYRAPASIALTLVLFGAACATQSPSTSTAYSGTIHTIPGMIEAEHYDEGAPGEAYYDTDEKNLGVAYRANTQVDIEGRPDASNKHGIGWTRAGEWIQYTVTVTESGTYALEFPVASNRQGGIFHVEMDGEDVSGPIEVPDTGGWDKLLVIRKTGVKLKTGTYAMRLVMDSEGASGSIGDIDYVRFIKMR